MATHRLLVLPLLALLGASPARAQRFHDSGRQLGMFDQQTSLFDRMDKIGGLSQKKKPLLSEIGRKKLSDFAKSRARNENGQFLKMQELRREEDRDRSRQMVTAMTGPQSLLKKTAKISKLGSDHKLTQAELDRRHKISIFAQSRPRAANGQFTAMAKVHHDLNSDEELRNRMPATRAQAGLPQGEQPVLTALAGGRRGGLLGAFGKVGSFVKNQFVLRKATREQLGQVSYALNAGRLNAAAILLNRHPVKPAGLLEKLVVGRTRLKLANTTVDQLQKRSELTDIPGVVDAERAVERLRTGGELGLVNRARANFHASKVFHDAVDNARLRGENGDIGGAAQALAFAQTRENAGEGKLIRGYKRLFKHSMNAGKEFAKEGEIKAAAGAFSTAKQLGTEGFGKFDPGKAKKWLKRAKREVVNNARDQIPELVAKAQKALDEHNDANGAAQVMRQVVAIEKTYKVQPGWRQFHVRQQQRELMTKLAPTIRAQERAEHMAARD